MLSDCWQAERGLSFSGVPFLQKSVYLYTLFENDFFASPLTEVFLISFYEPLFPSPSLRIIRTNPLPFFFGKNVAM